MIRAPPNTHGQEQDSGPSALQKKNSHKGSAGPVIEDSDLSGKAVLCAESLPMGIMHGMHRSLLVKVKYINQKWPIDKRLTSFSFFI